MLEFKIKKKILNPNIDFAGVKYTQSDVKIWSSIDFLFVVGDARMCNTFAAS